VNGLILSVASGYSSPERRGFGPQSDSAREEFPSRVSIPGG
jgi:hypothetical protein